MNQLCIVEDDFAFGKILKNYLEKKNFNVTLFSNAKTAYENLLIQPVSLVICDVRLPDIEGIELMKKVKLSHPNIDFIFMTGYANVASAVEAMKSGGFDYLSKPFHPDEMLLLIQSYFSTKSSNKKQDQQSISNKYILGNSAVTKELLEHVNLVAPTEFSVIITGESGTGKEVIAKMLHEKSPRHTKPFVAVDCGVISDEIATSAFFGHLKGSFTGAVSNQIGHFENANGGTLFLDEIGNLSYENQIKLLRALQEKKIRPLGSSKTIDVDVRVIVATNENLQEKIKNGSFREDLYHRLNEFSIISPPLRDRGEEILTLANFFLQKYARQLHKNIEGFDLESTQLLFQYSWPGNVRELENTMKRAALLCNNKFLTKENLPNSLWNQNVEMSLGGIPKSEVEKNMILQALKISEGNKSYAAQLLQISRKTLYNKMNQFNIDLD